MNAAVRWLLILIFSSSVWAVHASSIWYQQDPEQGVHVNVEVFLSSTCSHCQKADAFFKEAVSKYPYIKVRYHVINEDKEALVYFNQLLSAQNMDDFIVPSVYFCDSRWVGFASAQTTGITLLDALVYCKKQIEKEGTLAQPTVDTLRHWANANKIHIGQISHPSDFIYILGVALTDAFAPCSFFCFAAFCAFLFVGATQQQRLIGSLLFILAVGSTHYVQQVHTGIFYSMLPWLRIPAALIGFFTVYFFARTYKKHCPEHLFYLLAFLSGLIISAYQQTCIMNWSFIFQQWLTTQQLTPLHTSFYQLLYQLIYMFPLLLILGVYMLLLKTERFSRKQPRLAVIGLFLLTGIGFLLIIYPLALSYLMLSCLLIVLLTLGAFIKYRYWLGSVDI